MNEEVIRLVIQSAIKYARNLTNGQEALEVQLLYKEFMAQIGKPLEVGEFIQYNDKLYRVLQAHTAQADWTPDVAASLFVVIDKGHAGTKEDPIPAQLNMEYFAGKYYIENGTLYLCTRDSGIPLYYLPSALIGHYFEVVK
jgi:hypothetical protein